MNATYRHIPNHLRIIKFSLLSDFNTHVGLGWLLKKYVLGHRHTNTGSKQTKKGVASLFGVLSGASLGRAQATLGSGPCLLNPDVSVAYSSVVMDLSLSNKLPAGSTLLSQVSRLPELTTYPREWLLSIKSYLASGWRSRLHPAAGCVGPMAEPYLKSDKS